MGRLKPDPDQSPPDRHLSRPPLASRSWQVRPLHWLKALSLPHLLACLALLIGGVFAMLSLHEETALCALFALACLHQAHTLAADRERRRIDELLFMVLRQLDEVRSRKP